MDEADKSIQRHNGQQPDDSKTIHEPDPIPKALLHFKNSRSPGASDGNSFHSQGEYAS
jgi:hypothetical protein